MCHNGSILDLGPLCACFEISNCRVMAVILRNGIALTLKGLVQLSADL